MRGSGQLGLSGGWRRIVALFAVAACAFAVALCPELPEAFAAAAAPSIHGDRADHSSGHSDRHAACHRAAHASAVLQVAKAFRAGNFVGIAPTPATAVAKPVPAVPIGRVVAIPRAIDDRPRPHSTRFASFWPHAPPLTI